MKINIILSVVFAILLGATYLFQEKRVEKEHTEVETRDLLIQGEIVHLKLLHVEGIKKNDQWWQGDQLLSHNGMKQVEKKLKEIKKIKDIQGEWKQFFSHPIKFEVNHEPWAIGDMSLDKQSFYVSRKNNIYLAVVEGESTHLTQDEAEIETIKFNDLVGALVRPAEELKETQLFRFYDKLPLLQVLISAEGNLPFELDLENNFTLPPPIPGIWTHDDLKSKFLSLLTQVTIRQELPFSEKLGFKKLGELKMIGTPSSVKWELWLRNKTSADAIIIDRAKKKSWLIIGGTLKIFFIHVQDYWDKKVIPPKDFTPFSRLPVTFIQGSKKAVVTVVNKEPLSFEVKGHKVDSAKMDFLFQFLFNLGAKDQANRVSQLTSTERKQLLSGDHLRLELLDQELVLWRKTEELIVVNLTQGFKAHFNLVDQNFLGRFEDVLK
jgi:hypothetical protein